MSSGRARAKSASSPSASSPSASSPSASSIPGVDTDKIKAAAFQAVDSAQLAYQFHPSKYTMAAWQDALALRRLLQPHLKRQALAEPLPQRAGGSPKAKPCVLDEPGPPCHRRGHLTQVREHERITEKQLRQPFYYSRWYKCINQHCRTREIMPDEFRVWNDNVAAEGVQGGRDDSGADQMAREESGARPPWE